MKEKVEIMLFGREGIVSLLSSEPKEEIVLASANKLFNEIGDSFARILEENIVDDPRGTFNLIEQIADKIEAGNTTDIPPSDYNPREPQSVKFKGVILKLFSTININDLLSIYNATLKTRYLSKKEKGKFLGSLFFFATYGLDSDSKSNLFNEKILPVISENGLVSELLFFGDTITFNNNIISNINASLTGVDKLYILELLKEVKSINYDSRELIRMNVFPANISIYFEILFNGISNADIHLFTMAATLFFNEDFYPMPNTPESVFNNAFNLFITEYNSLTVQRKDALMSSIPFYALKLFLNSTI